MPTDAPEAAMPSKSIVVLLPAAVLQATRVAYVVTAAYEAAGLDSVMKATITPLRGARATGRL